MLKTRLRLFIGLIALLFLAASFYLYRFALPVSAGYTAKYLCSATFVSNLAPDWVVDNLIKPVIAPLGPWIESHIDIEEQQVLASLGPVQARAQYRPRLGCTLVDPYTGELASMVLPELPEPALESGPWPLGKSGIDPLARKRFDEAKLEQALENAFKEPKAGQMIRQTLAVLVAYEGKLVAERYANELSPETPVLGWSMAKSLLNALAARLQHQGRLDIQAPNDFAQWQQDDRRAISAEHLLRMVSGLEFNEFYLPPDDSTSMLYRSGDTAGYAMDKPLAKPVAEHWRYSSGSSNILSRLLMSKTQGSPEQFYRFFHTELFHKIAIRSAVFEPDARGTFVGSSYLYMTPRDWLRFGLLYQQDGVWQGERLFPEGWVAASTRPVPQAPKGYYGSSFWLNAGSAENPSDRHWPSLPRDIYYASGHHGQYLLIAPSQKLAVARFAVTLDRSYDGLDQLLLDLQAALLPGGDSLPANF